MSGAAPPEGRDPPRDNQAEIADVAGLKAVADPTRIRLLGELNQGARSVKELAKLLDVPPTRLYYHVKILEQAGLIRVAETRLVSGIEERRFEALAAGWTIAAELASALVEEGVVAAMLSVVRAELEHAFQQEPGTPPWDPAGPVPALTLTQFALSREQVVEVQQAIGDLMDRFASDPVPGADQHAYHFLFAGYRVPWRTPDAS